MLGTKTTDTHNTIWSRRSFLSLSAWGMFLTSLTVGLGAFVRFMFPRVLFEPSPVVKLGYPNEYSVGDVSERHKSDYRIWVARTTDGFYVLSAICTHLGCTPRWFKAEDKFKCPCHGSGFKHSGINYEGPAPRPLERLAVWLGDDGRLMVDKSKIFRYEKGEWEKPEAFLKFKA
jgi:cytochrome b6-f complex iron-sulfur subunit